MKGMNMPGQKGRESKTKPKKNGSPKTTTVVPAESQPVTELVIDDEGNVAILATDRAILEPIYEQVFIRQQELTVTSQKLQQLEAALLEGTTQQNHLVGMLAGFDDIVMGRLIKMLEDYDLEPQAYRIDIENWKLIKKPIDK